ncbi:hypothetical protein SPRG_15565 [Saprolegnia parasitica CBS 223.65]|uniref:Uncharacterized protein n=1 Tax=Saprolegnia parasitica (strain CBS 223.65) TaxID=695850 RepID=A0A067BPT3_SAPPC|nr:hypothetical protein SPRG_15565 [Saprolegnia parasitica CBS 223.65]KDO18775.1 hypothetical protein SPRG_15565 [Saprolegnia parasitica CBS 223.65]|eukprot:XP_012210521.1 hypothetical protein SPRG_15565 [Saprolegnia parasitica CBS 223.65]
MMALMLATSATAAWCTADQDTEINTFLAANVSTSCNASMPSWWRWMTFADGLAYDQYLMCRPPCKDDLQNLTSSIPNCTDYAGTYAKVDRLKQMCTDMTRPTTNGGACTTADANLLGGLLLKEPVWLNCSSVKNADLYSLRAYTTNEAKALCGSTTCSAFINAMANLMPSCVDTYGVNTMDKFRYEFGCTPAAVGANCSMVDMAVKRDAYATGLWSNCTTMLGSTDPGYSWTLEDLESLLDKLADSPEDVPSGFCASTCPANYLSMRKKLPSCTSIESVKILSDPSPLYRICPSLKPEPTPTPPPAPTSCTTDQETKIREFLTANVSTSCNASRPSWKSSMTFADGLYFDQYLMCQPPCKADLQNLTSSIPECVNDRGTFAQVDQLKQLCTNMTRPTTNGGACTTADSILYHGLRFDEPVWLNCSSGKNTYLDGLDANTTENAKALCGSATCSAFFNSMAKVMPNCVDKYGGNTMDKFRSLAGCTPAAVGANCSMIDHAVMHGARDAILWFNCSTFLNNSYLKTFGALDDTVSYMYENLPSGFCTSTCPANYLWIKKTLPSCTSYGMMLSDPSPLYRICPSLKLSPTPAPTPAPALTCPLPGSYRATGMRMDLATSGDFTESHDGSGNTCSTTGTYAVSGQTATFTVSTVSGVCGSAFTANAKLSGPISFSTDCNQLTLNYTGTPSTLQRASNAETAATSAMLLLGVFLASATIAPPIWRLLAHYKLCMAEAAITDADILAWIERELVETTPTSIKAIVQHYRVHLVMDMRMLATTDTDW